MRQAVTAFFFLSSLQGCSDRTAAAVPAEKATVETSEGAVLPRFDDARRYRPLTLSAVGSVGGTISLQGAVADSTVRVPREGLCADTAAAADTAVATGPRAGVLVWIDGVAAGKALPEKRRETLTIEHCRFVPRVLPVLRGTTINVLSRDRLTHQLRFARVDADAPAVEIRTMDAGQVVPSEQIAERTGLVEARDEHRPWVRGYVAVFDHPYFGVTDAHGAFKIESLPPGTYTLKVWHERLNQPDEQRVVIAPGGMGQLELTLTLR